MKKVQPKKGKTLTKKRVEKPRLHRIKEVLEEKKLSGYWLAKETGISYNSINGYVNNRIEPSLTNLFIIAEALGVHQKDLINS